MRSAILLLLGLCAVAAGPSVARAETTDVALDESARCLRPYVAEDATLREAEGGVPIFVSQRALVIGRAGDLRAGTLPGASLTLTDETWGSFWSGAFGSAPAVAPTARLAGGRVVASAGEAPFVTLVEGGAVIALDPCAPASAALLRWPYFPALLRALVDSARGRTVDRAPALIPARSGRAPLALAALLACTALLLALRRRARARDVETLAAIELGTPASWSRPGFERPLAGLLFHITAMLVLLGPYLYLTSILVPSSVQPYPEVDGATATIEDLLLLGWAIGDFGMTAAVVRAVAALRRTRPDAMIAHLRLLLRWQLTMSCALALGGALVAVYALPGTRYAFLSRALLVRSLTAPLLAVAVLPAICEALQRYDRQLLLELLDKRVLAVLLPIPAVLALRGLARTPADEATLALIGVIAGQGVATLATGIVGVRALARLGLPLGALLSGPGPARDDRSALHRYGAGIMAGKLVFFIAGAAELAIVVARLRGYPAWLGVKQLLLGRLLYPLWLLWPFCESAVPSLAEALAARRRALARGYVARYLQFGNLFVAALFALALGGGAPLVRARLPFEWHAAADLLPLAGLTGLLLPVTWIGDAVQRACGKSGLNATMILGEQLLRLALSFLLLPRLGLAGLFLASAIAAAAKTACVLGHVHLRLLPITLPARAVLLGPLAAGLAVGLLSRALVGGGVALGLPSAAFALAALLTFPVAFVAAALVGAFEPGARAELAAALTMLPLPRLVTPLASALLHATELGARIGPQVADHPVTRAAAADRDDLAAAPPVPILTTPDQTI